MISDLQRNQRFDLARLLNENLALYQRRQPCRSPWREDDPIFSPVASAMDLPGPTTAIGPPTQLHPPVPLNVGAPLVGAPSPRPAVAPTYSDEHAPGGHSSSACPPRGSWRKWNPGRGIPFPPAVSAWYVRDSDIRLLVRLRRGRELILTDLSSRNLRDAESYFRRGGISCRTQFRVGGPEDAGAALGSLRHHFHDVDKVRYC